jgi:hypothetical protein
VLLPLATMSAWRYPLAGGPVLIVVGGAFSALVLTESDQDVVERLLTTGLFFAPLVVAGRGSAAWRGDT